MSYSYHREPFDRAEAYRRANANLRDIGRHARAAQEADERKAREKKARADLKALDKANAIQRGHMVIERRELDKVLKPILLKEQGSCTAEENGMAEELQHRIDQLDEELQHFTAAQLSRFARAYRKTLK